ncbi:MAG TPA: hypothetical protein VKB90_01315 [Candidatus Acidoferrum sp.]|nr:hypothetical protein [Candidatus Acidoferrum sp.]
MQVRRAHAAELLRQAQAALRSVEVTASHNPDPLWAEEVVRCRKSVEAAQEALAEFDRALLAQS